MNKLKRHIERWNLWRRLDRNCRFHHFLVLLGLVNSPTFDNTLLPDERPNPKNYFYENDEFSGCGEVMEGE